MVPLLRGFSKNITWCVSPWLGGAPGFFYFECGTATVTITGTDMEFLQGAVTSNGTNTSIYKVHKLVMVPVPSASTNFDRVRNQSTRYISGTCTLSNHAPRPGAGTTTQCWYEILKTPLRLVVILLKLVSHGTIISV